MNYKITEQQTSTKQIIMPVLVYSRVSGYFNPTINFNKGKREEFSQRKYLNIKKALED